MHFLGRGSSSSTCHAPHAGTHDCKPRVQAARFLLSIAPALRMHLLLEAMNSVTRLSAQAMQKTLTFDDPLARNVCSVLFDLGVLAA